MKRIFAVSILIGMLSTLQAEVIYQSPEKFLNNAFGNTPEAKRLILSGELAKEVKSILGHRYKKIRVPYWKAGCRTAWILEEIGKEHPITTGFVVNSQGLEKVKVLIFRESRGWEVKHEFFTKQFTNAKLTKDKKLDKHIDNISGATLSVRAVTDISKIALLLHGHVTEESC